MYMHIYIYVCVPVCSYSMIVFIIHVHTQLVVCFFPPIFEMVGWLKNISHRG